MKFVKLAVFGCALVFCSSAASASTVIDASGSVTFSHFTGFQAGRIVLNGQSLNYSSSLTFDSSNNLTDFNYAYSTNGASGGHDFNVANDGLNPQYYAPSGEQVSFTTFSLSPTLFKIYAVDDKGSQRFIASITIDKSAGTGLISDYFDQPGGIHGENDIQFSISSVTGLPTPCSPCTLPWDPQNLTGAVPEPSTWAMIIIGLLGLGFMAYRKREQALNVA